MRTRAESQSSRRPRRWLACLVLVLVLIAIAAGTLLVLLDASRSASNAGVRTRLTSDWETVGAAASAVGGPAATPVPPAQGP